MTRPGPYMDSRTAPLNPCSVETIPEPIQLADGRSVWPLMVSCYQLEQNGKERRVGHMDLSLIEVPDIANHASAMPLQFDKAPHTVLEPKNSSGILDGKWSSIPSTTPLEHESWSASSSRLDDMSWCFASAHSTGEIRIHSFRVAAVNDNDVNLQRLESDPFFTVNFQGQSDPPGVSSRSAAPLCLSVSWDAPAAYKHDNISTATTDLSRIVSTYSNGTMAIHDVAVGSGDRVQLIERDSWEAHNIFTSPAEVWSACFAGRSVILSGGDEGKLKLWDIRATSRPVHVLDGPFEAGVTCISPHPVQEHIVAVGSCKTLLVFCLLCLSNKAT
jgi:WD40 repeat protein